MNYEDLANEWRRADKAGRLSSCWAIVAPIDQHEAIILALQSSLELSSADLLIAAPAVGDRVIKRKEVLLPWLAKVSLAARGRYQLAVLREADKLSPVTSNTLLKVLEEPPKGTLFVLLMTRDNLLPTLRSRVQLVVLEAAADIHSSLVRPDSFSATLALAVANADAESWPVIVQQLLVTAREGLRQGTVEPAVVTEIVELASTATVGLNRKLQLVALLDKLPA